MNIVLATIIPLLIRCLYTCSLHTWLRSSGGTCRYRKLWNLSEKPPAPSPSHKHFYGLCICINPPFFMDWIPTIPSHGSLWPGFPCWGTSSRPGRLKIHWFVPAADPNVSICYASAIDGEIGCFRDGCGRQAGRMFQTISCMQGQFTGGPFLGMMQQPHGMCGLFS